MARLPFKPNWGRKPKTMAAVLYYMRKKRRESIYPTDAISMFSALDLHLNPGDRVAQWPAADSSMPPLEQPDPLLQPIIGPNGGVIPSSPTSGEFLKGGIWPSGNKVTVLVLFIHHQDTNGSVVGSDPSAGTDRASLSHWGTDQSYFDWGNISSTVGSPGRIEFTYDPPLFSLTTSGFRKDGPDFAAFIDGELRTSKQNTSNYSGGSILTHITAPGQTDASMSEILELAVWDRPLSDQEILDVHTAWMQRWIKPIRVAHLDATALNLVDGSSVDTWGPFTAVGTAPLYVANSLNSEASVQFDGTGHLGFDFSHTGDLATFAVFIPKTGGSEDFAGYFSYGGTGNDWDDPGHFVVSKTPSSELNVRSTEACNSFIPDKLGYPMLLEVHRRNGLMSVYINGKEISKDCDPGSDLSIERVLIGSRILSGIDDPAFRGICNVGEFIMMKGPVSDVDIQKERDRLLDKWFDVTFESEPVTFNDERIIHFGE